MLPILALILPVLAVILIIISHHLTFWAKWSISLRLSVCKGLLRSDLLNSATPGSGQTLIELLDILPFLKEKFPETWTKFSSFYIEVVPDEKLPNDYGLTYTIREWLWSPVSYVFRVRAENAALIVAHELTRHLIPKASGLGWDLGHELTDFEPLEKDLKERMLQSRRTA